MTKIFRLHTEGINTLQDWDVSAKYSTNVISQIKDPNGASASKEITSIPSPFARMDLVKTAFREVVNSNNIDGNSIYHKLVSDCFDVGQLFFEIEKYRDQIEIIVWDKHKNLNELRNSNILGHKLLGETLNMFLIQDASTFNFNQLQRIYLLNYKNGPSFTNIIGATSPATLFFTTANDLSYVSRNIRFGNDIPFDEAFVPLYCRDLEYQKFWFLLQLTINNFANLFPEVNSYLNLSFTKLEQSKQQIIRSLTNLNTADYGNIQVDINAGNTVEVLGNNLYCRIPSPDTIKTSDFVIQSNNKINNLKPLVLPIDTYTHSAIYTQDNWNRNNKAPIIDSKPIELRTLPFDGTVYPYLTISDFLEDTIIRIPYEINSTSFYDGSINKSDGKSYLLPIKNLFFNFFSTEQLQGRMFDGKKMFEFRHNAAGISVILRIPIKKDYIEYHRTYYENNPPKIDELNNDGALLEKDFALALFPNIQFSSDDEAVYRIGLLSDYNDNENYTIKYFKGNLSIPMKKIIRNDNYNEYRKYQTGILEKSNFDFIQINIGNCNGIIIPKFFNQAGSEQFTFAVDFGTTNTHVEYSINNYPSKAFDISRNDQQIQLMSKCEQIEQYIADYDFIPETIGNNEEFKFPIRTALSEARNTNWNSSVLPFAHANIPFPYEKRNEYKYNKIITGLKWSNDQDNIKKVKCYIETLFIILRNKVILNNGDLAKTKIIWFYPISMTRNRFTLFKNEWETAYKKYFDQDLNKIIPITESIAPYEYYKSGIGTNANMVTIDIGGGTSDIVISEHGGIKYISSFRFAANSIFGNGYADNSGLFRNGIVQQFKPEIAKLLKDNSLGGLSEIFRDLDGKNDSENLASFFFSLKENKIVGDKIDFNKMLRFDESQKIIFIFFYTAIIYHLGQIMKLKNLEMPRYVNFSGNGSKILHILTTDNRLLADFTKLIFEKIYAQSYNSNGLTILPLSENPKEATCKGGISCKVAQDYSLIANSKVVMISAAQNTFILNETYNNILANENFFIDQTTNEVADFIKFTLELNDAFSFKNNFGIDSNSYEIAKNNCYKDLRQYTTNGLHQKLNEVSEFDAIEETLFFYPLNGMLAALSTAIYEHNQKS